MNAKAQAILDQAKVLIGGVVDVESAEGKAFLVKLEALAEQVVLLQAEGNPPDFVLAHARARSLQLIALHLTSVEKRFRAQLMTWILEAIRTVLHVGVAAATVANAGKTPGTGVASSSGIVVGRGLA